MIINISLMSELTEKGVELLPLLNGVGDIAEWVWKFPSAAEMVLAGALAPL